MKKNKNYMEKPMNEFIENEFESDPVETVNEPIVKSYKVTGSLVNLRKEPTRQSKIIKAVIIDTVLDISKIEHNNEEWCDYGYVDSEDAWINMNYVGII